MIFHTGLSVQVDDRMYIGLMPCAQRSALGAFIYNVAHDSFSVPLTEAGRYEPCQQLTRYHLSRQSDCYTVHFTLQSSFVPHFTGSHACKREYRVLR